MRFSIKCLSVKLLSNTSIPYLNTNSKIEFTTETVGQLLSGFFFFFYFFFNVRIIVCMRFKKKF